jgi:hypothetical protein
MFGIYRDGRAVDPLDCARSTSHITRSLSLPTHILSLFPRAALLPPTTPGSSSSVSRTTMHAIRLLPTKNNQRSYRNQLYAQARESGGVKLSKLVTCSPFVHTPRRPAPRSPLESTCPQCILGTKTRPALLDTVAMVDERSPHYHGRYQITRFMAVRYCALLRSMCGGRWCRASDGCLFFGGHCTFECFSAQGPPSHSPSHQTQPLPSTEVLSRCDAWFSIRNNIMWRAHMHGLRHGFFDFFFFFFCFPFLYLSYGGQVAVVSSIGWLSILDDVCLSIIRLCQMCRMMHPRCVYRTGVIRQIRRRYFTLRRDPSSICNRFLLEDLSVVKNFHLFYDIGDYTSRICTAVLPTSILIYCFTQRPFHVFCHCIWSRVSIGLD